MVNKVTMHSILVDRHIPSLSPLPQRCTFKELQKKEKHIQFLMGIKAYEHLKKDLTEISSSIKQLIINRKIKPSNIATLNPKFERLQVKMRMFQQKMIGEERLAKQQEKRSQIFFSIEEIVEELKFIESLPLGQSADSLKKRENRLSTLLNNMDPTNPIYTFLKSFVVDLKKIAPKDSTKPYAREKYKQQISSLVEKIKEQEKRFDELVSLAYKDPLTLIAKLPLNDLTEKDRAGLVQRILSSQINKAKAWEKTILNLFNKDGTYKIANFWNDCDKVFKIFSVHDEYLQFQTLKEVNNFSHFEWDLPEGGVATKPFQRVLEIIWHVKTDEFYNPFFSVKDPRIAQELIDYRSRSPIQSEDIILKSEGNQDQLYQYTLILADRPNNNVADWIESFKFNNQQNFEIAKLLADNYASNLTAKKLQDFKLTPNQMYEVLEILVKNEYIDLSQFLLQANVTTQQKYEIALRATSKEYKILRSKKIANICSVVDQLEFSDEQKHTLAHTIVKSLTSHDAQYTDKANYESFAKNFKRFNIQNPSLTYSMTHALAKTVKGGKWIIKNIEHIPLTKPQLYCLLRDLVTQFPLEVTQNIKKFQLDNADDRFEIALSVAPHVKWGHDNCLIENFELSVEQNQQVERISVVNQKFVLKEEEGDDDFFVIKKKEPKEEKPLNADQIERIEAYIKKYQIEDDFEKFKLYSDIIQASKNISAIEHGVKSLKNYSVALLLKGYSHLPTGKKVSDLIPEKTLKAMTEKYRRGLTLLEKPEEEISKILVDKDEPFEKLYNKARALKDDRARENNLRWLGYYDMMSQHHPLFSKKQESITQYLLEEIFLLNHNKMKYDLTSLLFEQFHEKYPKSKEKLETIQKLVHNNHAKLFHLVLLHPAFTFVSKEKLKILIQLLNCKEYHYTPRVQETLEHFLAILQNKALTDQQKGHLLELAIQRDETNKKSILAMNETLSLSHIFISSGYLPQLLQAKSRAEIEQHRKDLVEKLCPDINVNGFFKAISKSRMPNALFTLAATLAKYRDEKFTAALRKLMTSLANNTFAQDRYNHHHQPHFKALFENNPELLAEWRKGDEVPLKNGWKCVDSDDWEDLTLGGEDVAHVSCMKLANGLYTYCIFGIILDPKTRIITIKNPQKETIGRVLVKLLLDEKTNKPVLQHDLFMIKPGQDSNYIMQELKALLKSRAQKLKVPLVGLRHGESKPDKYPNNIISKGCPAPAEYVEANRMRRTEGIYTIKPEWTEVIEG